MSPGATVFGEECMAILSYLERFGLGEVINF